MKKGNDLIVTVGGVAVAASKSCTIQESCETKEAGMKGSGKWKQYIPGRKSWEVSTSFLVGDATTIKSLMSQTGTKVSLNWQTRGDETDTTGGEAIVTACKISGTRGNLVQGSFTFKGTGNIKYKMSEDLRFRRCTAAAYRTGKTGASTVLPCTGTNRTEPYHKPKEVSTQGRGCLFWLKEVSLPGRNAAKVETESSVFCMIFRL